MEKPHSAQRIVNRCIGNLGVALYTGTLLRGVHMVWAEMAVAEPANLIRLIPAKEEPSPSDTDRQRSVLPE